MPSTKTLRRQFQSCVEHFGEKAGRVRFVNEIKESLGLVEGRDVKRADGNTVRIFEEVTNENTGNPTRAAGSWNAHEYSLAGMALAIGGQDFLESFDPDNKGDLQNILEAGPGVDPTNFININTFNAATGGLIEAKILENFENPAFIGDQIFELRPTNKNGEKIIGAAGFGQTDGDTERKPGQPHPRAQFGERWVETPELVEKALACEVTQEAVFYDLTGQVLDQAASVGEALGYGRERTQLRLFAGLTNSYNYKGVSYDTYQTATPWINELGNPLVDQNDIDEALQLFANMTDPETGKEILVMPNTIVHAPQKDRLWRHVLTAFSVTNNTQLSSEVPAVQTVAGPYKTEGEFTRLQSTILRNLIDTEGSKTQAQANDYWYIGQNKKGFAWMEAWPLRVRQASPTEYAMLDRGLIAAYFANYRGVGAVLEPRFWVRNTNA
jgi:hypothetical protein